MSKKSKHVIVIDKETNTKRKISRNMWENHMNDELRSKYKLQTEKPAEIQDRKAEKPKTKDEPKQDNEPKDETPAPEEPKGNTPGRDHEFSKEVGVDKAIPEIKKMKSEAEIKAYLEGEQRSTPKKAGEKRIEELKK